jgi:hypothetical protein
MLHIHDHPIFGNAATLPVYLYDNTKENKECFSALQNVQSLDQSRRYSS